MSSIDALQCGVYIQTYKELNRIYHNYAKACGLSDTAFLVLYSLCTLPDDRTSYTQSEFCADWFYSKQTVNSAMKKLERAGLIQLEPVEGQRKNKQIQLTDAGSSLAEIMITPLIWAEDHAFLDMDEQVRAQLPLHLRQYNALLRNHIGQIEKKPSED